MRFILDMGISPRVGDWLKQQGCEAQHVQEINPKAKDSEILSLAQQAGAIILTADKDFSDLVVLGRRLSPSIILFRVVPAPPFLVIQRLEPLLVDYRDALLAGCLIVVDAKRNRMRTLPLEI